MGLRATQEEAQRRMTDMEAELAAKVKEASLEAEASAKVQEKLVSIPIAKNTPRIAQNAKLSGDLFSTGIIFLRFLIPLSARFLHSLLHSNFGQDATDSYLLL